MVAEGPLTAAQIYEQITGGEGTQSLADAQDSARQLTQQRIERAERINALRAKTMRGWQGGAGDVLQHQLFLAGKSCDVADLAIGNCHHVPHRVGIAIHDEKGVGAPYHHQMGGIVCRPRGIEEKVRCRASLEIFDPPGSPERMSGV